MTHFSSALLTYLFVSSSLSRLIWREGRPSFLGPGGEMKHRDPKTLLYQRHDPTKNLKRYRYFPTDLPPPFLRKRSTCQEGEENARDERQGLGSSWSGLGETKGRRWLSSAITVALRRASVWAVGIPGGFTQALRVAGRAVVHGVDDDGGRWVMQLASLLLWWDATHPCGIDPAAGEMCGARGECR